MQESAIVSAVLLVSFVFSALPRAEALTTDVFPDLAGRWFRNREAVQYLKTKKVMEGYDDGTFKPDQPINRAEFLKIVFAAKGSEPVPGVACFKDIDPTLWYAPYVCAAKRRGIVSGYSDDTFRPEQTINTAEAMKIMLSAYKGEMEAARREDWFEPYADYLAKNDILKPHAYIAWAPLTRLKAADLLWRVLVFEEDHKNPNDSAGCGTVARTVQTNVMMNGIRREFLLTIPRGASNRTPAPLIVAFHGRTNDNAMVRSYYGLDRQFDDAYIAYPAALKKPNGSFSWSDPNDKASSIRDLAFFDAIVETLADKYCINMDQIYTVGHSLGAWMANTVACMRGDVVRASATVGGDSVFATCTGPTAGFIAHNPKDMLASFAATEKARDKRIETNGCMKTSQKSEPEALSCVKYDGCTENPVLFCAHHIDTDEHGTYYPHTWPENTAQYIKNFFDDLSN